MMKQSCAWRISLILLMAAGSGRSWAAASDAIVTRQEAATMAEHFTEYGAGTNFPEWRDARDYFVTPIFSSDRILISYEVAIISGRGRRLGFVVVAAQKGRGDVVSAFSTGGESESAILESFYREYLVPAFAEMGIMPISHILVGTSTGAYAIGVSFGRRVAALSGIPHDGAYYLFSANPGLESMSFSDGNRIGNSRHTIDDSILSEEVELRTALLAGDFSSDLFHEISSGKIEDIDKSSGSVSGTFSKFYQEKRAWTKGGLTSGQCHAGCGPVAWAILVEYWDRKGYPKLVSTDTDNSNTSTTDSDVRSTINDLRGWLKTTCDSAYAGSTTYYNMTRGEYYAQGRGYSSTSASNTIIWSSWWDLISAIDSARPPLASIDLDSNGSLDHFGVVYSYADNSGNSNDKYCVMTGWTDPATKCFFKSALYGLTSVRVR